DLQAAAKLLEDNGYKDTNGDGIREMPGGGKPLDFRYYVRTENQNTVKAAPFIQDWLKQIGIKTEVTALTDGRLTDEINAGTYDDRTYALLWYAPLLQAYRTDSFTGFRPQPAPQGDLLDGYSRDAVLDIRPVSASAGGEAAQSTRARGIPAGVWIAIAAVVVLAAGVVVLVRRRGAEEREQRAPGQA